MQEKEDKIVFIYSKMSRLIYKYRKMTKIVHHYTYIMIDKQ